MTDKTTPERQPVADALPPLPASQAFSLTRSVYTADDMHAYARAALASRDAEIAKLRQPEPVAYQVKSYGSTSHIVVRADVADEYACKMREAGARNVEVHPLYASPPPAQPTQAEPLSDEDIAQLWSPHPGGEVRRPILGWGKVCDFARAIERLITERMSAGGTK